MKEFLKKAPVLKWIYRFLFVCKYEGFGSAMKKTLSKVFHINFKKGGGNDWVKNYRNFTNNIWIHSGSTDELIGLLTLCDQSYTCWKKRNNKKMWMIFISALYERGNIDKAKEILKKYVYFYGYEEIYHYVYASYLAVEVGIKDEQIERTVRIFKKLEENRDKQYWKKLVEGKKVAVVGNGGFELGKGNGPVIDEHDVVIRFNNYPEQEYEKDYGKKANIWIRGGNDLIEHRCENHDYDLVIWTPDFYHYEVKDSQLEELDMMISKNVNVIFMEFQIYDELKKASYIANPTAGCLAMWCLNQMTDITKVDVYGFSFYYNSLDSLGHFYDDLSKMGADHDMIQEVKYLRNLVFNEPYEPYTLLFTPEEEETA